MLKKDRIISESSDWSALFRNLVGLPSKLAGDSFERLTQLYLQTHPEYRTQLSNVWLLEEVPETIRKTIHLPASDEGIDILAETNDGKYWAIQCKFRSDSTKPLTYRELSTFTSLAFVTCKGISLAVVAHTCSKPIKKHRYLGKTTEIALERWAGLTGEDWEAIKAAVQGKQSKIVPRKPRSHQRVAIRAAKRHFRRAKRGRLIMPCGTGKSLTAFWIAKALDARSIIVAVPSLALIRQTLIDWTREFLACGEIPKWLVVCSDDSTANLDRDEFVGETYDLGIPTTTDSVEIGAFLRGNHGRRIIFTTYQSSAKLAKAAKKSGITLDLAILDEAHKTVGVRSKVFAALLSERKIAVRKRLFMTATERVLSGKSDDVFSMDDANVYGECFHQLSFKRAIADKIISDYRVLTISVGDEAIRKLIAKNRLIKFKGTEVEAQEFAASIALRRAIKRYRLTHIISFHRSIRAASSFCDQQNGIEQYVRPKLISSHISSKKAAGERAELIREFTSERRALMTNARCLTEGVDVPAIDCVLFADPKNSVIDIVQASGRTLRPHLGKSFGYILIPLVVPKNQSLENYAETTAFKQVARTIAALSAQDERIVEQFRAIERGRKSKGNIVEFSGDVPSGIKLSLNAFAKSVRAKIWQRVGKVNWRDFREAREYVQSLGLRSWAEWRAATKEGKLPPDIPSAPNQVYRERGWISNGDWLGTGRIANRERVYRPFQEARAFAHRLNLKKESDWRRYKRENELPLDIPSEPQTVFKNRGWVSMGDWLGTGFIHPSKRIYRSFKEARKFVRTLNLKSRKEWNRYANSPAFPKDLPSNPVWVYRNSGWRSSGDWLGTGFIFQGKRKYRPFRQARAFVKKLGLKSERDWRPFTKSGKLPADIPATPALKYRDKGWAGMGDWLGTGTVAFSVRKLRPFKKARAFAQSLGMKSEGEWKAYAKSGKLPPDIPRNPRGAYRDKGWVGTGDWLGTGRLSNSRMTFLPFTLARDHARKLKMNSGTAWRLYAKSGRRPKDIPAKPEKTYKTKGWRGISDWLGTGN